jgi:serine/threonine protein kinase
MVRESSCSLIFLGGEEEEEVVEADASFEASYELVGDRPLGEGTFGVVWRCQLRDGEQRIQSVKRVAKSHLKPRDVRNLFGYRDREGEIQMHLRLKHPHVVELSEYFDDLHTVSLVMEFCSGGDLFDLVASHKRRTDRGIPEPSAATVLRHVLSALAFLHGKGIVHRDVKCENVLLAEADMLMERTTYKLCDFGFAALLDSTGTLRTQLGSPDAVAPEIAKKEAYSTPADVWSAGVMLYMALSASSPFWGRTDYDVLCKVKQGNFSFKASCWRTISQEAKNVISALLTVDPHQRVTAEVALEHPWVREP